MGESLPAITIFVCLAAAALCSLLVYDRLPEHRLREETHNVVKHAASIFVVMTSLVLGPDAPASHRDAGMRQTPIGDVLNASISVVTALRSEGLLSGRDSSSAYGATRPHGRALPAIRRSSMI